MSAAPRRPLAAKKKAPCLSTEAQAFGLLADLGLGWDVDTQQQAAQHVASRQITFH